MSADWAQLRAKREALGLQLDAIAEELRIPAEHLDAIERGELSGLPDGPYRIGWLRAYCGHIGVDPGPFVDQARALEGPDAPQIPVQTIRGVALVAVLLLTALVGWQLADLTAGEQDSVSDVPPEPDGPDQHVKIRVERAGRITVWVDGREVTSQRRAPGEQLEFAGHDRVEVELPAAEAARVEYNGALVVPQGRQDAPRRLVFIDDLDGE